MIAKKIEKIVKTGAVHFLYSKTGSWYNHLKDFPGVLYDVNGYIIFRTEKEYLNNNLLRHGKELNIPEGISKIRGYVKFSKEEKDKMFGLF